MLPHFDILWCDFQVLDKIKSNESTFFVEANTPVDKIEQPQAIVDTNAGDQSIVTLKRADQLQVLKVRIASLLEERGIVWGRRRGGVQVGVGIAMGDARVSLLLEPHMTLTNYLINTSTSHQHHHAVKC